MKLSSQQFIETVQILVNSKGYQPKLKIDGDYGPKSRMGVKWLKFTKPDLIGHIEKTLQSGTENEAAIEVTCYRGYFRDLGDPGNDLGIYDDIMIVTMNGREDSRYRASGDPGMYWIRKPMSPKGCARLQDGVWRYRPGSHLKKYKAFVQAEAFTVDRLDKIGKKVSEESGWFAINLHSGGPGMNVNQFSAGCQIVQSGRYHGEDTQWSDFRDAVLYGLEKDPAQQHLPMDERTFRYTLVTL